MNTARSHILHIASLFLLGGGTLAAAPPAAENHRPIGENAKEPQARRMPLVRRGYAYASPDSATITMPFSVEGDTAQQLETRRADLLHPLDEVVKQYDNSQYRVSVSSSQTGQTYHDGKPVLSDTGTIMIYVRNMANLKAIVSDVVKITTAPLTVNLRAQLADYAVYDAARKSAQGKAIATARRDADGLAKAAGTKIIGVLELHEGEFVHAEDTIIEVPRSGDFKIPSEVLAATAHISIVFEMAPSYMR